MYAITVTLIDGSKAMLSKDESVELLWERMRNYAEAASQGLWIGDVDLLIFFNPDNVAKMELKECEDE